MDGQEVCAFIVHSIRFQIKLKYKDYKRGVYDNYLHNDKNAKPIISSTFFVTCSQPFPQRDDRFCVFVIV